MPIGEPILFKKLYEISIMVLKSLNIFIIRPRMAKNAGGGARAREPISPYDSWKISNSQ